MLRNIKDRVYFIVSNLPSAFDLPFNTAGATFQEQWVIVWHLGRLATTKRQIALSGNWTLDLLAVFLPLSHVDCAIVIVVVYVFGSES